MSDGYLICPLCGWAYSNRQEDGKVAVCDKHGVRLRRASQAEMDALPPLINICPARQVEPSEVRSANLTGRLLSELLHADFGDSKVAAAVDLPTTQARKGMAELLKRGYAKVVAPRVYACIEPLHGMVAEQYGLDQLLPPAPFMVAAALCRQHGWEMAMPSEVARFMLGFAERPLADDVKGFLFDQDTPFDLDYWKRAPAEHQGQTIPARTWRVSLTPGDKRLFGLTPCGQALVLSVPRDASEAGLKEIGERAAGGTMSEKRLLGWLAADMESGLLNEREMVVANAIVEAVKRGPSVPRKAPRDFEPPEEAVTIEGWGTEDGNNGVVYLTAKHIQGHPYIPDGDFMTRSSPLMWLDEDIGWARTRSRVYKLGKRRA